MKAFTTIVGVIAALATAWAAYTYALPLLSSGLSVGTQAEKAAKTASDAAKKAAQLKKEAGIAMAGEASDAAKKSATKHLADIAAATAAHEAVAARIAQVEANKAVKAALKVAEDALSAHAETAGYFVL